MKLIDVVLVGGRQDGGMGTIPDRLHWFVHDEAAGRISRYTKTGDINSAGLHIFRFDGVR